MEIYNIDYNLYVQDGEHEPKQMTNFTPVIETAYYPLEGSQDGIPGYPADFRGRFRAQPYPAHDLKSGTHNCRRRAARCAPQDRLCTSRPEVHRRPAFQNWAPR